METRRLQNQSHNQLLAFKKSIKREVSQYTILKDEKYFEAFKRNPLITATTHDCEEILDGHYKPENNDDGKELFKQKKYFMYSILDKVLQHDMGKTIVRKYAPCLDAQSVWREFGLTCPPHLRDAMKGIDYMHMYLQLSMIDLGKALLNNLFIISMNNLDDLMKSHHSRNIYPTLSD